MPYPVFSPPPSIRANSTSVAATAITSTSADGGEFRCIDLKTLKTDWEKSLSQNVLGAVVVTDDKLYFGCCDGKPLCL